MSLTPPQRYETLALGYRPGLGQADGRAGGHGGANPLGEALRDLRRRLGPTPMKALFEGVAGPLAQPHIPGTRFGGLRTVAFDGCNLLKVPDTENNRGPG